MNTNDSTSVTMKAQGVSRRSFLGTLGLGVGVTSLGLIAAGTGLAEKTGFASEELSGRKGILFDATKCIGCHYCEGGCKNANELSSEVDFNIKALADTVMPKELLPPEMLAQSSLLPVVSKDDRATDRWLRVTESTLDPEAEDSEKLFVRHACTHCGVCARVCPSGSLKQREDGIVTSNSDLCIGCYYCYQACPFDIPRFIEEGDDKTMRKCTMCADRIDEGESPGCVRACPADALSFGPIEEMVHAGKAATESLSSDAYLYGEKELGGMGVLSVLSHSRRSYGLPEVRT